MQRLSWIKSSSPPGSALRNAYECIESKRRDMVLEDKKMKQTTAHQL
jgi:hypothetical protein